MFGVERWSAREIIVTLPIPYTAEVHYLAYATYEEIEKALPLMKRAASENDTAALTRLANTAGAHWTVPMADVLADEIAIAIDLPDTLKEGDL